MTRTLTLAVLFLAVVYGGVKAWPLLSGPSISLVVEPQSEYTNMGTSSSPVITTISGVATHTETLTLNGKTLLIDGDGNFKKTLTLPHGGVILSLTATDRFGNNRNLQRALILP